MSFWDLSDGSNAKDTGTGFEIPSGGFDPIPHGSSVLAYPEAVKWQMTDPERTNGIAASYIEITWKIAKPEEFKGRTIFHKIWATDLDPGVELDPKKGKPKALEKRDKARRMLAAIDANAGGRLSQNPGIPSDSDLGLALVNKMMVITLAEWEGRDGGNGGNWVSAVAPKDKALHIAPAKPKKPAQGGGYGGVGYGGGYGGGAAQGGGYGGAPAGGGYGGGNAGGGYGAAGGGYGGAGGNAGGGWGGGQQQSQGGGDFGDEIPF